MLHGKLELKYALTHHKSVKDVEGTMPGRGEWQTAKDQSGRFVDPYADWEQAIRPGYQKKEEESDSILWQPVYLRVLPDGCTEGVYKDNALKLYRFLIDDGSPAVAGQDTIDRLGVLYSNGKVSEDSKTRIFVYLPEDKAGLVSSFPKDCVEILDVGVAVPGAFVTNIAGAGRSSPTGKDIRKDIVVTAIIDDDIRFAHERFRDTQNSTRIRHFWKQGIETFYASENDVTVALGKEFDKAALDQLISTTRYEPEIYRRLLQETARAAQVGRDSTILSSGKFYDASYRRSYGFRTSHGAHVMDVAAGAPVGVQSANFHPIVAVELPELATLETNGARLDSYVLQAVHRIFSWVDNWHHETETVRVSVVINLSYGITAGPKDGTGLLERELALLAAGRESEGLPTKFVLPAGNAYRGQLSGAMALTPKKPQSVDWCVQPGDKSPSFLEIRTCAQCPIEICLKTPDGEEQKVSLLPEQKDHSYDWDIKGRGIRNGRIYCQRKGQDSDHWLITLALSPTQNYEAPFHRAPAGTYKVSLKTLGSSETVAFFDVQRDDSLTNYPAFGRQAYLDDCNVSGFDQELKGYFEPSCNSTVTRHRTLSPYVTHQSEQIFSVGGTFDHDNRFGSTDPKEKRPSYYSASADSHEHAPHPDISAVSEDGMAFGGVLAAGGFSGSSSIIGGTSVAAPQVTRLLVEAIRSDEEETKSLGFGSKNALLAHMLGRNITQADTRMGFGTLANSFSGVKRKRRRYR